MVGSRLSDHVPIERLDQGINYIAPTLPSLLWEWVNAKHTGGVPNHSCLARFPTAGGGLASGEKVWALLLLLKEGVGALSKALQVLLGLPLYRWTMSPPWGPHRHPSSYCSSPKPLLSHPLSSGPTSICVEQPWLTWPLLRVSLVLLFWVSPDP